MTKLRNYRVLKTYTEWEEVIVSAKNESEAWTIAIDNMDELDWKHYEDGGAEEIVSVKEMR